MMASPPPWFIYYAIDCFVLWVFWIYRFFSFLSGLFPPRRHSEFIGNWIMDFNHETHGVCYINWFSTTIHFKLLVEKFRNLLFNCSQWYQSNWFFSILLIIIDFVVFFFFSSVSMWTPINSQFIENGICKVLINVQSFWADKLNYMIALTI